MRVVYKYEIYKGKTYLILPEGSKILSAKNQRDSIFLWAEVEEDSDWIGKEGYDVSVVPTGVITPGLDNLTFLDTVLLQEDSLVFHVYYRKD